MDSRVANIARKYFNPRSWLSGTEQMAPMLYAMIRMTRPRSVIEYGTGYTTLFILQALADSMADYSAERAELLEKTRASGILDRDPNSLDWKDQEFVRWFNSGGRATTTDPAYYLTPYTPHLHCFENKPTDHSYVIALTRAVDEAGLGHLFTLRDGATMGPDVLPEEAKPIDLVWWDSPGFDRCHRLFWSALNPDGGTMMWHDVASGTGGNWRQFRDLTKERNEDVEVLVLPQPNKLDQNSVGILRRASGYRPPFARSVPATQVQNARELLEEAGRTPDTELPETAGAHPTSSDVVS